MYMYYFGLNRYLNHIYSSVFSQEMSNDINDVNMTSIK